MNSMSRFELINNLNYTILGKVYWLQYYPYKEFLFQHFTYKDFQE